MASAEPSSKRSEIKVLKALKRKAIITRLTTKKMMVPRLMVHALFWEGEGAGRCGGDIQDELS